MNSTLARLLQAHPALSILRLAVLSAGPDGALDDETQVLMFEQVKAGVLTGITPTEAWSELSQGLMAQTPSNMFRALYDCGALEVLLPEVAALFGVEQIANDPPQVDIGDHLLRVLDETARCNAPLPVRFAVLVMNVGKSDSPSEHLPVHYRHIERGRKRIVGLCERLGIDKNCRDIAMLALVECERIHRVTEVRAGPVALMLERLGAFSQREQFKQLMMLCACDYRAYPGYEGRDYPKAALLDIALEACANIHESGLSADTLQEIRAAAIATAFRSERWSNSIS